MSDGSDKTSSTASRPREDAMDEVLGQAFAVLDHGFIRVIDYMGNDAAIVQAARVSYGQGTKSVREDERLIRYLIRHRHSSPFEMAEIKLHIKLPIFVARQWIRHRTASVNEVSARYSVVEENFYVPVPDHVAPQSRSNRQGREGGETIPEPEASRIIAAIKAHGHKSYELYRELLNHDVVTGQPDDPDRASMARESARMVLGLQHYTEWYWKTDLRNLMHFIQLRIDAHAQAEIRVYAEILLDILHRWVPITARAFRDYQLSDINLSLPMLRVIRAKLAGGEVSQQDSGLSMREWRDLGKILGEDDG